ncbi:MAG: adenosylcobinamide-GDP ribazoletransferase [Ruthenibacterium lactatiformans]
MTLLETAAVAFAMFSAVPVPQPVWNEKNMRYALCAFPLVGVVCGLAWWGWAALAARLSFPLLLRAAGLCLAPVLVTGGIHLDGYADTCDALASCAAPEKKQEILKDPHCGAFAVIRLCTYFTAYLGLCAAVDCTPRAVLCMGLGFVLERALPAMRSRRSFGKNTGLAHTFATGQTARLCAARCLYCAHWPPQAWRRRGDDGRCHGAGCGVVFLIPARRKAVRRHIGRPGRMVCKGGVVDAGCAGSVQPAFGVTG